MFKLKSKNFNTLPDAKLQLTNYKTDAELSQSFTLLWFSSPLIMLHIKLGNKYTDRANFKFSSWNFLIVNYMNISNINSKLYKYFMRRPYKRANLQVGKTNFPLEVGYNQSFYCVINCNYFNTDINYALLTVRKVIKSKLSSSFRSCFSF